MKLTALCLVGTLSVITACGAGDQTPPVVVERDSSGTVIVENSGPYPIWKTDSAPELRIGAVEGDATYQFHRVQFTGRLADGRVVVVDAGSNQVRWYSPTGEHRSSFGRRGAGPKEFLSLASSILIPGDTLVVYDPRNRRATFLSPREAYVGERALREGPSGTVTLLGRSPRNSLAVAVSTPTFDVRRPNLSYTRDTLSVVIHSAASVDTVVRLQGTEGALWVRFAGGQPNAMQQMGLPFAHHVLAGNVADRLIIANGDNHEVEIRDWRGTRKRVARRMDARILALTNVHLDQYVRHEVQAAVARGAAQLGAVEENARARLAVIPGGHTVPSFDLLVSTGDGRIWLRDFAPPWTEIPQHTWTVYGSDGRVEYRAVTPGDLAVMHIRGDHVTGVVRDSLDVEYVVIYRLERVQDGGRTASTVLAAELAGVTAAR